MSDDSPGYNQNDLISNAVYIYLGLLFGYTVTGVIIYGVREYVLSFNDQESTSSNLQPNVEWSSDSGGEVEARDLDLEALGSYNKQPDDIIKLTDNISSLVSFQVEGLSVVAPEQIFPMTSDYQNYNIIQDEINTEENLNATAYLEPPKPKDLQTKAGENLENVHLVKIRYSFKELYLINNTKPAQSHSNPDVIKISQILSFEVSIPQTHSLSVFASDKLIRQLRIDFEADNDMATKAILLLKLASICVEKGSNIYFLNQFNELVEVLVDTGKLVDLLEYVTSDNLNQCAVKLLLNYCWNHYNFPTSLPGASCQSRTAIFRILCNLKVGISSGDIFTSQRIRRDVNFSIQTIMREVVKRCQCNDYLELCPMIAQSIDIVEATNSIYEFYDLLHVLIDTHCNCCMEEYLSDSLTDLKAIIQHGWWFKNDAKIISKTNEIFSALKKKNEKIYEWLSEVQGGQLFVGSTLNTNTTKQSTILSRQTIPGALRIA